MKFLVKTTYYMFLELRGFKMFNFNDVQVGETKIEMLPIVKKIIEDIK